MFAGRRERGYEDAGESITSDKWFVVIDLDQPDGKEALALSLQGLDLYLQFRICVFIQFRQYPKKKCNTLISKSDIWILSHDLVCLLSKTTVNLGHLPSTTTRNTSNQGEKQPKNKQTKNHL